MPAALLFRNKFRKRLPSTTTETFIDIFGKNFIFKIPKIFKYKKITVPFSEIEEFGFKRNDIFINSNDSYTTFTGYELFAIQKKDKKDKMKQFDFLKVANETDAKNIIEWFNNLLKFQQNQIQNKSLLPTDKIFTFKKTVTGENIKINNIDKKFIDFRYFQLFKDNHPILKISMPANTVYGLIETESETYLITRNYASDGRKEKYLFISVNSFEYSVVNLKTGENTGLLNTSNLRTSYKPYLADFTPANSLEKFV